MHWSKDFKSLRRGVRLATRVTLAQLRRNLRDAAVPPQSGPAGFTPLPAFKPNPGRLRGLTYQPGTLVRPGAPLVVLLHGCGQDAAGFAVDAGWTALADRLAVPLLLPEQQEANHRQRCFQWFKADEIARGRGEAGSTAAMVRNAIEQFGSDPRRVFVAGMSAGGAMTAALLAAYPDLFSAGAVVAGLPVGVASGAMSALSCMARGSPVREPAEWAELARAIAPPSYPGPWPRLSVWHGMADDVVTPGNGEQLATQWVALHGLSGISPSVEGPRESWEDAVELWRLPALGHVWPVANTYGRPASGIAAAPAIARFWGLE